MCLDCGCMLPANEHNDKRHITYKDYQKGDRPIKSTADVNSKSLSTVKVTVKKTLSAINSGSLSPTKRSN